MNALIAPSQGTVDGGHAGGRRGAVGEQGAAIIVIPAGLAILGAEFLWAQQLLAKMRRIGADILQRIRDRIVARRDESAGDDRDKGVR